MLVRSIRLFNFRAHAETTFEFTPNVNLIFGPNGAGKTNVLEALHYLCLTKSFTTSADTYALRRGAPHLEIEGSFSGDRGGDRRIRMAYAPRDGKRIMVDGAPLDRLSDVVGLVPVVVYSPEDYVLTAGGPDERRRFLNNIMSQERPVYMDDLLKYRRALRQRKELLGRAGRGAFSAAQEPVLLSWTAEYVRRAARIIAARRRFVTQFAVFLEEAYMALGETVERPSLTYRAFDEVEGADDAEIADRLHQRVEAIAMREREGGRTLLGPHRDDLIFRLHRMEVRRYASQGQHRTFGMALKLAQYLYLQDHLEERPLLLLDDVFGNLDAQRTEVVLRLLESQTIGQSIITAAEPAPFRAVLSFNVPENSVVEVRGSHADGAQVVVPSNS